MIIQKNRKKYEKQIYNGENNRNKLIQKENIRCKE